MFGVSTAQLFMFTKQFSAMVKARLDLVIALENLGREMPRGPLKLAIDSVKDDVTAGQDLADAMAKHPKVFNSIYVGVVRAGLNSGRLANALAQLSTFLERKSSTNKKVTAALVYPLFIVAVFTLVFHLMVFGILPRFSTMYETLNRDLPDTTQFLLDIGDFYGGYWPLIASVLGLCIVTFLLWTGNRAGRQVWDEFKLRMPLVGSIWRLSASAQFLQTFGLQVRYRVPAVEALRQSASATGNYYLSAVVTVVADRIDTGSSIAAAFRGAGVFDDMVVQMIATGERAGTLDELLISAADYFDTLVLDRLQRITAMINPALTTILGLGIAGMLIAAFLPVFELSGNMA